MKTNIEQSCNVFIKFFFQETEETWNYYKLNIEQVPTLSR